MKLIKNKIFLLVIFSISIYLFFLFFFPANTIDNWEDYEVKNGKVERSVTATGPLNPVLTVNVGTQISGIIENVFVDYNDIVKKGMLLAEVDSALIDANISQLEAAVLAKKALFKATKSRFFREQRLFNNGYISLGALEKSESEYEEASSRLKLAEAELVREKQKKSYSKVISPIDGVVIDKKIDVGQTVAASFQTPTLFKIAENLDSMQIEALVSEADIGEVRIGQKVTFVVDAYFENVFSGEVKKIRLDPKIEQNVVNYVVIISVKNKKKLLLPGMTAQASIIVELKKDVLKIPLSALRFEPGEELIDKIRETKTNLTEKQKEKNYESIYIIDENQEIIKKNVLLGISDYKFVEVLNGLSKGDKVVIRKKTKSSKKSKFGFRKN